MAGTIGSSTYGVAKRTSLIGVKVLSAAGSGSNAGVLAGIDWAVRDATQKGRIGKSVLNLSLGGPTSPTTNQAVAEAVNEGMFLAVAAGNSGLPTITASPASAPEVCTVGASDSNDARASFSNFGLLVDIFAPGVDVTSTWIDGPDDTNTISGTSMASPHVAGLAAYFLGLGGAPNEPKVSRIANTISHLGLRHVLLVLTNFLGPVLLYRPSLNEGCPLWSDSQQEPACIQRQWGVGLTSEIEMEMRIDCTHSATFSKREY